jgi:HK97 family phage major capsid protein
VPEGETVEIEGREYTGPVNIRMEWDAQEASLVPLGADSQAQIRGFQNFEEAQQKISRNLEKDQPNQPGLIAEKVNANDKAPGEETEEQAEKTQIKQQPINNNSVMEDNTKSVDSVNVEEQVREAVKVKSNEFDKRADAILALGEEVGDSNWAISQIRSGASVEDAQREAIGKLKETSASVGYKTEGDVGLSKKERERYSLSKAMLALANGKKPDGIEKEVSDFIFIDALRPKLVASQAGITILNGLTGNVVIPKQTASATATWKSEVAAFDEGDVTYGQITLEPQHLGCYTDVSKQLLAQGTPDVDTLLRNDLSAAIATGLDKAVFRGSGSGEPQGIDGASGVETSEVKGSATGGSGTDGLPTAAELFEFVSDVEDGNALDGSLAWVTTPTVAGLLKQTQLYSNTDSTMWDWRNGNTILGYPAFSSTNADTNDLFFGAWDSYVLGIFDGVDIVADIYTGAKTRLITYVVNVMADGDVRHGQSFCTNA